MKRPKPKPPPLAIPRLGSLLHRLQHAPKAGDQSRLDQLMIFLEDPPPRVRDRWKQGAKMCTKWGIPCTGASVWRLYRAYALEWRLRLAHESSDAVLETNESLEEKAAQLIALRTVEVLADPHSPPACLVGLVRIEFRKRNLDFARQKHKDDQQTKLDRALNALADELDKNRPARVAFEQFVSILEPDELSTEPSQP